AQPVLEIREERGRAELVPDLAAHRLAQPAQLFSVERSSVPRDPAQVAIDLAPVDAPAPHGPSGLAVHALPISQHRLAFPRATPLATMLFDIEARPVKEQSHDRSTPDRERPNFGHTMSEIRTLSASSCARSRSQRRPPPCTGTIAVPSSGGRRCRGASSLR